MHTRRFPQGENRNCHGPAHATLCTHHPAPNAHMHTPHPQLNSIPLNLTQLNLTCLPCSTLLSTTSGAGRRLNADFWIQTECNRCKHCSGLSFPTDSNSWYTCIVNHLFLINLKRSFLPASAFTYWLVCICSYLLACFFSPLFFFVPRSTAQQRPGGRLVYSTCSFTRRCCGVTREDSPFLFGPRLLLLFLSW